ASPRCTSRRPRRTTPWTMSESLILALFAQWFPEWEPPKPSRSEWQSVCCPFHGDTRPSASLSATKNAFICFSCGMKGDALALIMKYKEVTFAEALDIAEGVLGGSLPEVQRQPPRKPRRRAFGESWAEG